MTTESSQRLISPFFGADNRTSDKRTGWERELDESFDGLGRLFRTSLRAKRRQPSTIRTYAEAVRLLQAHLRSKGMPLDVVSIRREHVEDFLADLGERAKPTTVKNRFLSLQQWFKWLVEEGEIRESPMARMKAPATPLEPAPVLTEEGLKALIRACEGKGFDDRRDMALLRLYMDTGARLSEIATLEVGALDRDAQVALVTGKGNRIRGVPFGPRASLALERYLRQRETHAHAKTAALWLGLRGPMTPNGAFQALKRRAKRAGIDNLHPHLFRHTFAHQWLADGGSEGDLMRLMGWRSRQMLTRYAASTADQRAREAYWNRGFGDRF